MSLFTLLAYYNINDIKIEIDNIIEANKVIFNANEGATPVTVLPVCVIKDFDVIDNIEGPDDLEEFLMDDDLNEDLGNSLQDNNLFPNYEDSGANPPSPNKLPSGNWNPVEEFQDFDHSLGIVIDVFVAIDDLWDDLDPGALTNEQPLKPEFHSIGNRVNRYNPYNLQITCKIGFVNFNPYIDQISPFNIMSRAAYNSIITRELIYTGNNNVRKAKNLQVFIRCHSFLTDFIILKNVNEFVEKGIIEVLLFDGQFTEPSLGSRHVEDGFIISNFKLNNSFYLPVIQLSL
nr:hypothetical protein [Tanacetum cinerariifolium]